MTERMIVTCAHCGKEFETYPSKPAKFCSRACFFASRDKRQLRTCRQCGSPFLAFRWQVERGYGIYCSKECADAAQRGGPDYTVCQFCGKPLPPDRCKRTRFCSKSCAGKATAGKGWETRRDEGWTPGPVERVKPVEVHFPEGMEGIW